MKRSFLIPGLLVGSFLLPAGARAAAETFRIGLVDLQQALQTVNEGKKAKQQLEKEMNDKRKSLEKQQAALQKETEEFEKKAAIMNESARAQKQAAIQKKIAEFQKTYGESQMALQKRERELTKPIIDELRAIVEGLGKAKQFHLIVEKNEGAVLYAQNGTELTKEVIEAFNKRKK